MKSLSFLVVLTILLGLLIGLLIYVVVYLEKQVTSLIDKVNNLTTNIGCLDTRLKSFISDTTKYFVRFNDALVKEYNVLKDMNDIHKASAEHICKVIDTVIAKPKKKTTKVNTENSTNK